MNNIHKLALEAVVSCGMHSAQTCFDCPGKTGGPPMCNGQCKWDYTIDRCVDKQGKQ